MSDKKRFLPSQEFKMPKMGESITEGTIINWLVAEGDSFEEGDILLEVATDKVDNEVPAPSSGKMLEHKFKAKDVVPVGEVIAILQLSENAKTEEKVSKSAAVHKEKPKGKISTSNSSSSSTSNLSQRLALLPSGGAGGRPFISPLVDSIAKKKPHQL